MVICRKMFAVASYVCRAILPIDKAIDYRIALNNSLEKICD